MMMMLKRQRRRLALFALFVAMPIACLIAIVQFKTPAMTYPIVGAIAFAAFTVQMGLLIAVLRFAPRLRVIADQLVVAMIFATPSALGILFATNLSPYLNALLAWCVVFLVLRLINGVMSRRSYHASATYRTSQSSYAIWATHYPDPGLLDRHWTPALQAIELDVDDPDIRRITYEFGHGTVRQEQMITEMEMHESFAYEFYPLSEVQFGGTSGDFAMKIKEQGPWRDVTLTLTLDSLPVLIWLGLWLDDHIADQTDHHVAQEKGLPDYSMTADLMRGAPVHQSGLISPNALPA